MAGLTRFLRLFAIPVAAAVLLLQSGCGANPASPGSSVAMPSAAALGGNWLIVGSLPFSNPVGPVVNGNFGLSITFAVTGDNLIAASTQNLVCGGVASSGLGSLATGTVAADGSFTLAPVTGSTGPTLQMSAIAPASGATSFSGTYSYVNTGTCVTTQTGSFTATKVADVTGTYTGTASFSGLSGSSQGMQSAALTLNLQQGAIVPGTTSTDQELLTGAVTVTGLSCISTGTARVPVSTSATAASGVLGTEGVMLFAMNDGSTLELLFDDENTGSTRLAVLNAIDSGGTCGTFSSGSFEVAKQ